MVCAGERLTGAASDVLRCGHPVLSKPEGAVQPSAAGDDGMAGSPSKLVGLDWPVPDYSTWSRRQKTVTSQIACRRSGGPLSLLADCTGVKMRGDGEWRVREHGPSRRRQ